MDLSLTEEQKMLKTMVRDFTEKELEPIAAKLDEEARFPAEQVKKLTELGLAAISLPEQYGGGGLGKMEEAILGEELSHACAAIYTILFSSSGTVGYPLYKFGTEEQRQRFLVPIAKGEKLACFALTEPGAGSDIASLETTATRQRGGYKLNGHKIFITIGAEAEIALV